MSDDHTPEERAAHFGPGGPVEVAKGWLEDIVFRHDILAAWKKTDPDYRLALTQAIVFLNEQSPLLQGHDRESLTADLSREEPVHPLWSSFAQLLTEEFLGDLGEINVENWGRVTPRPVGPGYELVLFSHSDDESPYPPEMTAHGVLMHLRDDRWQVAGLSERPAVPGWPPDLGY